MIVAILNVYLVILFLLVKLKIIRFTLFWKCSPLVVLFLLMFGLFIPMGWGAPSGVALVVRNSVPIVPNVAGEVIDVPVKPNRPLKAGDVLFKIDPVPYQAAVDQYSAQLLTRINLPRTGVRALWQSRQMRSRASRRRTRIYRQPGRSDQDEPASTQALSKTRNGISTRRWCARPPTATSPISLTQGRAGDFAAAVAGDGLYRCLRHGRRRNPADRRPLHRTGQDVEITFKTMPGTVVTGSRFVLQAISAGQVQVSGLAVTPKEVQRRRSSCASNPTTTPSRAAAGRQRRHRGDLYRSHQASHSSEEFCCARSRSRTTSTHFRMIQGTVPAGAIREATMKQTHSRRNGRIVALPAVAMLSGRRAIGRSIAHTIWQASYWLGAALIAATTVAIGRKADIPDERIKWCA